MLNELTMCVIKDGIIMDYSSGKTDELPAGKLSTDISGNTMYAVWVRPEGMTDTKEIMLSEYKRQMAVNKIADIMGR